MAMLHYDLDNSLTCRFYTPGMHDNYLLVVNDKKYILRIYRNRCRSEQDIMFELDWIQYINSKTNLVAQLIPTRNESLAFKVDCPEGPRFASLFHYADGTAPGNAIKENDAKLLGSTVAQIHQYSDDFAPTYTRQLLDANYLLDGSIQRIRPYLNHDGYAYLCSIAEYLHLSLPEIERTPGVYGLCIGDVNPTNFHINESNKITLFDLDQCGYAFRAFEIGKFFSSIRNNFNKLNIQTAFLKSYQGIRPLSEIEQDAIPLFEIVAVIWVMAIQVDNADLIGDKYLEQPVWDRRLNNLKQLVSEILPEVNIK